jgi:sec-independent protein translocase protein TatB
MFPEGRIFDVLIVGVVALIVVGPKDLPILMRKIGQFTARMRGMAAEFRASFDEMARHAELDELRTEIGALRSGATSRLDVRAAALGADPERHKVFEDIHIGIRGGESERPPLADHLSPAPEMPTDAPGPAKSSSPAPFTVGEATP